MLRVYFRYALVVASLMMCVVGSILVGCSDANQRESGATYNFAEVEGEANASGALSVGNVEESGVVIYSIEDVPAISDSYFVENNGECRGMQGKVELEANPDAKWVDRGIVIEKISFYTGLHGVERLLSVDRQAGDKVLTTEEPIGDTIAFSPVLEVGYWPGFELKGLDIEEVNGKATSLDELGIEGFGFTSYDSSIPSIWSSPNSMNVTVGYYDKTQWKEENLNIDVLYFIGKRNNADQVEVPFERTRDGYFIVDISGLNPGYYSTYSRSSYYVFEIV